MPAPPVALKVEGLTELRRAIRDAGDKDLAKTLRDTNRDLARQVAERAAAAAPRRTGRLAASVKGLGSQTGASIKAGSAARVPYAAAIHWGWRRRNIRPRPFLRDAAQSFDDGGALDLYEQALNSLFSTISAR